MAPDFQRWGEPGPAGKPAIQKYRWPAIAIVALVIIVSVIVARSGRGKPKAGPLDGYQRDVAVLTEEYRRYHGKLLHDPEVEHQFQLAGEQVSRKNYAAAIEILNGAATQAAVPIIFNNLGALYAAVGDRARAITAFREALARDGNYGPVRDNIAKLRGFTSDEADPVTHEIEPNNNEILANLIGV